MVENLWVRLHGCTENDDDDDNNNSKKKKKAVCVFVKTVALG